MLMAFQWPISFDRPAWLLLLLVIPVMAAISMRSLSGLDTHRRVLAVVLRSLVVLLLALALARIQFVKRNENVAVIFVLDRSRSIPEDLRFKAQDYVRKVVSEIKGEHRFAVVGFDGRADLDMIPSRVGTTILDFSMAEHPDRTNLAAAVRLALAAAPEGFAKRVVLFSDGNENIGSLTDEIEAAVANQTAIDVVPLQYLRENEILFDKITVPAHASDDTQVPVRLIIKSRKATRAKLALYHGDREVPLADPEIELSGNMRPDPFTIPIQLKGGGIHRFDARLTPLSPGDDTIPENNRATAFTFVEAQGRVLVLTQLGGKDDAVLVEALRREKIDVEMRDVDEFNLDLLQLQEYSVVMLCNISADKFNEPQHKALASFVRDFGGGLIMLGGNESFGAGGWIGTPIEKVSPVSFEIKHKKVIPRGALAIIMHSCEIPRGNYWGEQVAIASVNAISSQDYLGVLCYSWGYSGVNWDVPLAPVQDKAAVIDKIKQMQIGDMPDFGASMELAVTGLMQCTDAAQRHIIIISDGDPSPPLASTIKRMQENQITCSTVGIGYGSHVVEQTLIGIARQTGGRFYACKNPRQLPQIFVKESKVIKRSLLDERTFQPRIVGFSQAIQGIRSEDLPQLDGLVLTSPKNDITMPIIRRGADGDDPVLAYWNYEMGKMAVFTSGWWTKWGARWASWESFGKFWAQLVRWATRQQGSADFDIVTRLEGGQGKIMIEALNKDASYLNFLRIQGRLTTPAMETEPLHLYQTGPGRYEGSFEVNDDGNYLVNLRYSDAQHEQGVISTGLSVPYSPEYRELNTNFALLDKAAERTGGRVLDLTSKPEDVFSRQNLPISVSRQPIWRWVVIWLLLPMLLLDVAGRRLASTVAFSVYVEVAVLAVACAVFQAWHGHLSFWSVVQAILLAEIVGWAVRYRSIMPTLQFLTHTVTALSQAGQRSTRSLSQLKGVRERVRKELDEKPVQERVVETFTPEPSADARRRFDVGDRAAEEPAKDLADSLGSAAAKKLDETPKPGRVRPGQPREPEDDTTSRLLRAKRRAREEMERQDEDKSGE